LVVQAISSQIEHNADQAERKHYSRFFAALLLVILFDVWFGSAHPLSHATTVNMDRSEVFYAFSNYLKEAHRSSKPIVVFLGSSVLLQPVMEQEANYLNNPIRPFEHRKLASLVEYSKKYPTSCFPKDSDFYCLAMGGEMASDAYLLLSKSVSLGIKPQSVIYASTPRDFQCNSVPSVVSTPMYKLLASLADIPQIAQVTKLSPKELADFIGTRISSLYKYREDIAKYLWLRTKKIIDRFSPIALFEKNDGLGHVRIQKTGMFPDDVPGVITLTPGSAMGYKSAEETLVEYRHHYDPVDLKKYEIQLFYFSKLVELCRAKGIKLVTVNMPLSTTNRNLIPAGFYSKYLCDLQRNCSDQSAKLIDLQKPIWDSDANYTDTVHIKPDKVPRFLDDLFSKVAFRLPARP